MSDQHHGREQRPALRPVEAAKLPSGRKILQYFWWVRAVRGRYDTAVARTGGQAPRASPRRWQDAAQPGSTAPQATAAPPGG